MILIAYWEYIEQLMILLFQSFVIFPNNDETEPDNMISDITMGLLGSLLILYYCGVMRIPRNVVPVLTREMVLLQLKYHFQFLIIAALSVMVEVHIRNLWYGYIFFGACTTALIPVFGIWNRWNDRWRKNIGSTSGIDEDGRPFHASTTYVRVHVELRRYILEYFYLSVIVFVFFASFYFRYTGVFKMVVIHAVVFFLLISFVLYPLRDYLLFEKDIKRYKANHSFETQKMKNEK
jgi:hypothetical protein